MKQLEGFWLFWKLLNKGSLFNKSLYIFSNLQKSKNSAPWCTLMHLDASRCAVTTNQAFYSSPYRSPFHPYLSQKLNHRPVLSKILSAKNILETHLRVTFDPLANSVNENILTKSKCVSFWNLPVLDSCKKMTKVNELILKKSVTTQM